MTKSQQVIAQMLDANTEIFKRFREIHDKYAKDSSAYQEEFNQIGEEVMTIIRKYERILMSRMGSGQYNKYSNQVSEVYWREIRALFPKIDFIGVEIK
ncbi:MAG: hypothetical protein AAB874_05785 [Patescibacteria group bacterium]